jgi:D-glycerate 3-kinase
MTDAEIAVFIQHYERLTNHIQAEMPARADIVVRLGRDRQIDQVTWAA